MKYLLASLVCLLAVGSAKADDKTLVVEGIYQSKNLYVTNCMGENGVGFAVSLVRVNGKITTDQISSSAFEIDLSILDLKQGEDVVVQIEYDGPCTPKVLNPGVLQPMPTFETTNIEISNEGMLKWETTGELGKLPYVVQQFKWNKWVKIGEVDGEGTPDAHAYSFSAKLVSGQNKFRVIQKNLAGDQKASKTVSVVTDKKQPTFEYKKSADKLIFTEETSYEVYDMYGQIRKRGLSQEIDLSNLEKGDYYLNFDNAMEKFKKR